MKVIKILCLYIIFSLLISQDWTIKIEAEINLWGTGNIASDEENYIGVDENALDGYDVLDVPEPPHLPNNYITIYFPHPEWESDFSNNFTQDIKFNDLELFSEEGKTWYAEIYSDASGETMLNVQPNENFPNCEYSLMIDGIEHINAENIVFYLEGFSIKNLEFNVYNCENLEKALISIPDKIDMKIFPNPFNGNSKIEYNVFYPTITNINIYDINGRVIEKKNNFISSAGKNEYRINSNLIKTGIYFIKIETEKRIETKKFIVLK